ncbi:hypothetical protein C0J52_06868 [Blattella germanica]|nr:hypothetical protein C0J52_06868 [Blattella germanica]
MMRNATGSCIEYTYSYLPGLMIDIPTFPGSLVFYLLRNPFLTLANLHSQDISLYALCESS